MDRHEEVGPGLFEKLPEIVKGISVLIGCIVIVVGLVYVVYVIDHIFALIDNPKVAEPAILSLHEIIRGDELLVTDSSFKITLGLGRPVALAIYVFFIYLTSHLALGLILYGAKVIAWTTNERGAMKKLIDSIFGPGKSSKPYTENIDYEEPNV